MAERAARMKAQRDLLRQMKDKERQAELEQFNAKTTTKQSARCASWSSSLRKL